MEIPNPNSHDHRGAPLHAGILALMHELGAIDECSECGATYDEGLEDDAINEAWFRRKQKDPSLKGLTLRAIRVEVARICANFGYHDNCSSF